MGQYQSDNCVVTYDFRAWPRGRVWVGKGAASLGAAHGKNAPMFSAGAGWFDTLMPFCVIALGVTLTLFVPFVHIGVVLK